MNTVSNLIFHCNHWGANTAFITIHESTAAAPSRPSGLLHAKFIGKTYATKFICVKTVSNSVVRHSLAYLPVHKWLAGDETSPFMWNILRDILQAKTHLFTPVFMTLSHVFNKLTYLPTYFISKCKKMLLSEFPDLCFQIIQITQFCRHHQWNAVTAADTTTTSVITSISLENACERYQSCEMELNTAKDHWLAMRSQVWSAKSVFVAFCSTTTYTD